MATKTSRLTSYKFGIFRGKEDPCPSNFGGCPGLTLIRPTCILPVLNLTLWAGCGTRLLGRSVFAALPCAGVGVGGGCLSYLNPKG